MSDYTRSTVSTINGVNAETQKIQTAVNSKIDKSGGAFTGTVDMNEQRLINLPDATDPSEAMPLGQATTILEGAEEARDVAQQFAVDAAMSASQAAISESFAADVLAQMNSFPVEGALAGSLALPDSNVLVGAVKAGILALAEKLAVQPGQFFGDIQAAVDYAYDNGRGYVFVPEGTYMLTSPLIIPPSITFFGERNKTVLVKTNSSTHTGSSGVAVNSIIHLDNPDGGFNFYSRVSGFQLSGDSAVDGIYMGNSAHAIIENINMNTVKDGISSAICFMSTFDHVRVGSASVSAFNFSSPDDKTSLTFKNCYGEACANFFLGRAIKYSTMFSCGADYINTGGKPGNPYGAAAKGNYLGQGFVFNLAACDMTISGSGCEQSTATYLYAESCNLEFNTCTVFNLQNYYAPASTNTAAIWIAGVARSTVQFNSCAFDPFVNNSGLSSNLVKGLYIETPSVQKVFYTTLPRFTGYSNPYVYEGAASMYPSDEKNYLPDSGFSSNITAPSLPLELYNAGVYTDSTLSYTTDPVTRKKSLLISGVGSSATSGLSIDHRWRLVVPADTVAGRGLSVSTKGSYSTGGFGAPAINIVSLSTFNSPGTILFTGTLSAGAFNINTSIAFPDEPVEFYAVEFVNPYQGSSLTVQSLEVKRL